MIRIKAPSAEANRSSADMLKTLISLLRNLTGSPASGGHDQLHATESHRIAGSDFRIGLKGGHGWVPLITVPFLELRSSIK